MSPVSSCEVSPVEGTPPTSSSSIAPIAAKQSGWQTFRSRNNTRLSIAWKLLLSAADASQGDLSCASRHNLAFFPWWICSMRRKGKIGNVIYAYGFKLRSSKRKIDLMFHCDQEKISRLRLPNCAFFIFRYFFFFPSFSFSSPRTRVSFPSFFLGCTRFTALRWFVSRAGGSFDQKRASLPIKSEKNNYSFSIFLVAFFIFPLFFFFFFLLISNSVTSIVSFPLRTSTTIRQTIIAVTARMICEACYLEIIFLLVRDNVSLKKYREVLLRDDV